MATLVHFYCQLQAVLVWTFPDVWPLLVTKDAFLCITIEEN